MVKKLPQEGSGVGTPGTSSRRGLNALLVAQFLSAFADNAILFTAIAMVLHAPVGAWYVPALQAAFLVSFVVFAPWVGPFADRHAKARVLLLANAIKAGGTVLMFAGVEPIAAYAVVGVGATVYSPAKYGLLPELVSRDRLVSANGWIEGSTIAAIIVGTILGARVADESIHAALAMVAGCYLISLVVTFAIPTTQAPVARDARFIAMMRSLWHGPRARFAILGAALFWGAAAVLRMLLVAWAPLVLHSQNASQIAQLTLSLALGVVVGSLIAPRLVPMEHLRRTRYAAYGMGLGMLALTQVHRLWSAHAVLAAIGLAGGIFMVPINAALQDSGRHSIGSGGAVAMQNFFENVAMLVTVAAYSGAAAVGTGPVAAIAAVGLLVLAAAMALAGVLRGDVVGGNG